MKNFYFLPNGEIINLEKIYAITKNTFSNNSQEHTWKIILTDKLEISIDDVVYQNITRRILSRE
jgi:hypothetical protein